MIVSSILRRKEILKTQSNWEKWTEFTNECELLDRVWQAFYWAQYLNGICSVARAKSFSSYR